MSIPTTQEQIEQNRAYIEGRLNQTTPPGNRAYNTVIAAALGMQNTPLYHYADDRAKASMISTCSDEDLDQHGIEWDTPRNEATASELVIAQPGDDGMAILLGTVYLDYQGLQYQTIASVTAPTGSPGSGASMSVQCLTTGTVGNLTPGTELRPMHPISGATGPAVVSAITTAGNDREEAEPYRERLLAVERSAGGGGNLADYRNWAQSVANVYRAYPYSGLPYYGYTSATNPYAIQSIEIIGSPTGGTFTLHFNGSATSALAYNIGSAALQTALRGLTGASAVVVQEITATKFVAYGFTAAAPVFLSSNSLSGGTTPTVYCAQNQTGARTVYVECVPSYIGTGIPDAPLLASVRQAIRYNERGEENEPQGSINETLFVVAIQRIGIYLTVSGLTYPATTTESTVKSAISSAAAAYLLTMHPYIDGLDAPFSRNDLLTQTSVNSAVQSALSAYGASAISVAFGTTPSGYLPQYQLAPGVRAYLVSVAYA